MGLNDADACGCNAYSAPVMGDHAGENHLSEVGFEPTPGEPDCDLNAAP